MTGRCQRVTHPDSDFPRVPCPCDHAVSPECLVGGSPPRASSACLCSAHCDWSVPFGPGSIQGLSNPRLRHPRFVDEFIDCPFRLRESRGGRGHDSARRGELLHSFPGVSGPTRRVSAGISHSRVQPFFFGHFVRRLEPARCSGRSLERSRSLLQRVRMSLRTAGTRGPARACRRHRRDRSDRIDGAAR